MNVSDQYVSPRMFDNRGSTVEAPSISRLSWALLLVSFATVLFTLAVWKLLSFFIMPSLFFDLLFVGFPLGALFGVRFFGVSLRSFLKTLWLLQLAMVLSVAACLLCKHADYLRAHLFEVKLGKLMAQMLTFTVLFIPFFCAYGLSEYVGYQFGTAVFGGRMRVVYATYLFGAAIAYLILQPGLRWIGITGVLVVAILSTTAATALLSPGRRVPLGLLAALVGVASAFLIWPGATRIEGGFLALYKGTGPFSTQDYEKSLRHRLRFQQWGKYSLTEIMSNEDGQDFVGFYNDFMQWEFAHDTGFSMRMLGAIPINIAPRDGRIAIVGAGGGRQVKWALLPQFQFQEILALELEPAVLEAVMVSLKEEFGSVYHAPNVRALCREARGYMESSTESFDLIFMPSVGGYPQMMLEPGNMIRTSDAYRTLKSRLSDRGILAIWYPSGLDPVEILTKQYVRTLGAQGLGMQTRAYRNQDEYLILATKDPSKKLPTPQEIDAFFSAPDDPSGLAPRTEARCRTYPFFVPDDPLFKPITDEQPFLAGNVRHIFSLEQLYVLFAMVAGFLVLSGAFAWVSLRRVGNPQIPGRTYAQVAATSLLVGANFILFEHYVVLALFKRMYIFQDALALGAVSFLILSGLGSVIVTQRSRPFFQGLALLCLLPVLFLEASLPAWALLALVLPVAFATGSFFPGIFELAQKNPLAVFAMDAIGAALGSAVSFFIPIAFGFRAFFPIGACLFTATALVTWAFCRKSAGERRAPAPASEEVAVQ